MAKWRASGLTQAEFCRREGIPEWKLSGWKRREQKIGKEPYSSRGKPRRNLSAVDWPKIIAGYTNSGMTFEDYCRMNGVSRTSFRRAIRKFGKVMPAITESTPAISKTPPPENPFFQLRMVDIEQPVTRGSSIEVTLPGGCTIQVTESTPITLLSKLLKAMEAQC